MKPGRRPIPARLKELAGNPGRRPIPPDPISLPAKMPSCPEHLDDVARAEWDRVARLVEPLGLIKETDRTVLAAYCQCYARWRDAEERLRKSGMLVMGPDQMPIVSPYLAIANRALYLLSQFMLELGFSPAGRKHAPSTASNEEADAFFSAGRPTNRRST